MINRRKLLISLAASNLISLKAAASEIDAPIFVFFGSLGFAGCTGLLATLGAACAKAFAEKKRAVS